MVTATAAQKHFTLEEFMANPCDRMEWVDGKIVEKNGATLKHGKIQLKVCTGASLGDYRFF